MATSKVILVAEDEDNDFFLLDWAFAKQAEPVSLSRAKDGVEAVQYLEGANGFSDRQQFPFPELLILDLKMPGKDGFEVLEWLQAHPAHKRMIVLVLSSSTQDRDISRAYGLGAHSYLTKPNDSLGFKDITQVITDYWFHWVQRPGQNGG